MAETLSVVDSFRGGMKRDFARTAMPQDSLWSIIDLLPDVLEAPARKRGGYSHESPAVSGSSGSSSWLEHGIWVPFTAGDALIAFDAAGYAYAFTSSAATAITSDPLRTRNPLFYRTGSVIVPGSDGTTAPKKITSTAANAMTALGGSPPAGRYVAAYKDVIWLAGSSASAQRIHFSLAGDPETWDTTDKWYDVSFPISGLAALQNAMFVFGYSRTARFRGSVPPPDSDFVVDDPIFDVGCTDNRSISLYRDKVVWGNGQGLYISDGTALEDLTRVCGMKSWWQDIMAGDDGFSTGSAYSVTGWSIATGVYGDWLVYSVMNGTTEVDSGMIDLTKYTWYRISNIDAPAFFPRPYTQQLFFPRKGASAAHPTMRVGGLAQLFYPAAANKADADDSNVLPVYETPYGPGDAKLKTVRRVFLTHDTRDAASDDPTQTVSYIDSPEETSYTTLPTTGETTEITRVHRPINKPVRGIAFKVAQTGPSSDTRHYGLELEVAEREGMK